MGCAKSTVYPVARQRYAFQCFSYETLIHLKCENYFVRSFIVRMSTIYISSSAGGYRSMQDAWPTEVAAFFQDKHLLFHNFTVRLTNSECGQVSELALLFRHWTSWAQVWASPNLNSLTNAMNRNNDLSIQCHLRARLDHGIDRTGIRTFGIACGTSLHLQCVHTFFQPAPPCLTTAL